MKETSAADNAQFKACQQIANAIMRECSADAAKVAVETHRLVYGVEPEFSYVSGCNCAGDYCGSPFLHGTRINGEPIK